MYQEELKIPKERVAVLIGKKGETKRTIEKRTKTKIKISRDGDVKITAEESVNTFIAAPIVKAIGRGFNPEIAALLTRDNFHLELIDLRDFAKDSKAKLQRIRSRLIGTGGKARKMLEQLTNTYIVVQGRTAAIIGAVEEVHIARQAIEKLLGGAPHSNVYQFIEAQMRTLRE
ncbi:RNA-processing protein [Candidatus Woesearchaeota archaeon]|nr:RNA-processing protein [Candidatus Woesearchaeota archaeon]